MKKKLIFIFLLVVIGIVGIGCKDNSVNQKINEEIAEDQKIREETFENGSQVATKKEMVLNEPLKVSTEYGDYTLTMERARETAERNSYSEASVAKVVFLDYIFENISFGESVATDLNVDQSAFQVMDDSGNMLTTYPVYDDNRWIMDTPVGAKCNASIAYALPVDSKNIKIIFKRTNNQKLGEITIPIS